MGFMKGIYTRFHNNGGKTAFGGLSQIERRAIQKIIENRHTNPKRQELVGHRVVMLAEVVKEPVTDGNYIVIDVLTGTQEVVSLYSDGANRFVLPLGSTMRTRLDCYNQAYMRWVALNAIDREIVDEVKKLRFVHTGPP